mmetsp:Transcript_38867/g.87245  ORF Transcript_38867/g.87245 Transcript_38867/m.87245 type:complete len:92 (+) Transcript_38867:678-953(+)
MRCRTRSTGDRRRRLGWFQRDPPYWKGECDREGYLQSCCRKECAVDAEPTLFFPKQREGQSSAQEEAREISVCNKRCQRFPPTDSTTVERI